jgi:hypothetical protein
MEGCPDGVAREHHQQGVTPNLSQHHRRAEPDLERAEVMDEVLVVWREDRYRVVERCGGEEGQRPKPTR